jgi:hypothetical protein
MPKERMHLGEVPDSVFQQKLFEYLQRKEANPDAKRVPAQFEYNGVNYTFQRARSSSGFQIKRSSERVAKESKRRGQTHNQAVKLSEAEQMMTNNLYEEAQKRGLQVDHKAPIAKGGPSNHPAFLGLMTPEENARKGTNIGGNYRYEPLIEDQGSIKFKRKAAMAAAAGGAVAPAFLGTAASASELQTRTEIAEQTQNPIDRVQQGIAGTSLALDAVSYVPVAAVPAGIASAALDVTNLAIDTGREFIDFLGSIRLHRK